MRKQPLGAPFIVGALENGFSVMDNKSEVPELRLVYVLSEQKTDRLAKQLQDNICSLHIGNSNSRA